MTHSTNLYTIKFIGNTGDSRIPKGEGLGFHPEWSRGSGWLAMAFILPRNWGRYCFLWFGLPLGVSGGSLRTFLRADPDVRLKMGGGQGWDLKVVNQTWKRQSATWLQGVEWGFVKGIWVFGFISSLKFCSYSHFYITISILAGPHTGLYSDE